MLQRSTEMGDTELPIVSICIVADKNKAPPGFVPIAKTHDDATDADLWKDGFGFGLFNRTVRYIAVSRQVSSENSHLTMEVVTDLAVISEKEAVPSSFVCIDFTVDSKERALKKKCLCARFTSRNDALDAVTDVVVLAKSRRAPKGYAAAGEIDGMLICFRVATIPENYGRLSHSQSNNDVSMTEAAKRHSQVLYPPLQPTGGAVGAQPFSHSSSDIAAATQRGPGNTFTIRPTSANQVKGVDGVPFQLNPVFARANDNDKNNALPNIPEPSSLRAMMEVNLRLERQVLS